MSFLQQLLGQKGYEAYDLTTTTRRPRPRTTPRPARPILDGLSWLWRTWQDTAPGAPPPSSRHRPTATRQATASQLEDLDDEGIDLDDQSVSIKVNGHNTSINFNDFFTETTGSQLWKYSASDSSRRKHFIGCHWSHPSSHLIFE